MNNIQLTAGQQQGLDLVRAMTGTGASTALITGYAGTGKTTLLKTIIEDLGGDVVLLAPTGKAASRITEVTGSRASTIHLWMYKTERHSATGEPMFIRRPAREYRMPASNLVVVDEASMVGPDVYQDLIELQAELGFNLLFVGDGFQLPPVQGRDEQPFNLLTPGFIPDNRVVRLTEITRQALDSPIIRATLAFREGDPGEALSKMDIVMPEDVDDRLKSGQDMVICWRNETRHALNAKIRQLRGLTDFRAGEPLLVLKNNYGLDIYNGEIHSFGGWQDNLGPQKVSVYIGGQRQLVEMNFGTAMLNDKEVVLCKEILAGQYDKIGIGSLEKAVDYWLKNRRLSYVHANAGYALTCHKAQGSEADSVLVCMESSMLRKLATTDGRRWIYTATTRARKELAISYI